MILRRGFKFRVEPMPEQEQSFAKHAGACRFVYNKILALNDLRYEEARFALSTPRINYHDSAGFLKLWKKTEEFGWLKSIYSQCLQQALMDLNRAYTNLFEGRAEPPTKRKKFLNDSFRFPQGFEVDRNRVKLPKIGWVTFKRHRKIEGTIKNVTVSRKGGHWFISFQTELEVPDPVHPSDTAAGGDMGIAKFLTLSDGTPFEPINSYRKWEKKLAKLQRKLAGKVKFSNGWKRLKAKINRLHTKIADCRHDFLHKVSRQISQNHAVVVLEDLKVKNMSASASGTVEQPGRQVAQKSGLNKSILDQGWGMFRTFVEYKQTALGGQLILVPPQYTSQMCSACGCTDRANRPAQETFVCQQCGLCLNADHNAALNILAAGVADSLNGCPCGIKSSTGALALEEAQVL